MRDCRKNKYTPSLAEDMIGFFESYDNSFGAPSFEKFARAKNITVATLQGFRRHKLFDRAYRECIEIRRDYLIDNALMRRFDPTFVRHLLADDGESGEDTEASFTLRVIE